jgi:hypothetical protein
MYAPITIFSRREGAVPTESIWWWSGGYSGARRWVVVQLANEAACGVAPKAARQILPRLGGYMRAVAGQRGTSWHRAVGRGSDHARDVKSATTTVDFFRKGNGPSLCIKLMHTAFFIKILLQGTYYKSLISESRHMDQPLENTT